MFGNVQTLDRVIQGTINDTLAWASKRERGHSAASFSPLNAVFVHYLTSRGFCFFLIKMV